ncbi:MAG: hypothetical protein ACRDL5_06720, partial [Solirubrobacteraceae bacterium]
FAVALANGLRLALFSAADRRAVQARSGRRRLAVTVRAAKRTLLVIALRRPARSLSLSIAVPALAASRSLRARARAHPAALVPIVVTARIPGRRSLRTGVHVALGLEARSRTR